MATKSIPMSPSDSSFSTNSTAGSSTSSRSSHVEVESVEKAFWEGHFADALTLANRCLKQAAAINETSLDHVRPLLTPLVLQFDVHRKVRYLSFQWDTVPSSMNMKIPHRAAAIVLQSWYELARRDRDTRRYHDQTECSPYHGSLDSFVWLQPLLDTYTSTVPGDCWGHKQVWSLELLVLYIQWLASDIVSHTSVALALTIDVLRHVRFNQSSAPTNSDQEACRSLLRGFWTVLLPRCDTVTAVRRQVHRLTDHDVARYHALSCFDTNDTKSESNQVVQQCLLSCTMDQDNWPRWLQGTLQECRLNLTSQLRHEQCTALTNRPPVQPHILPSTKSDSATGIVPSLYSGRIISIPLWLQRLLGSAVFKGEDPLPTETLVQTSESSPEKLSELWRRYTRLLSRLVSLTQQTHRQRHWQLATAVVVCCAAYHWFQIRKRSGLRPSRLQ